MGEKKSNGHDKDSKIVHFPARKERDRLKKEKDEDEKKAEKERKTLEKKEEQWRAQYRAERARTQSHTAQKNASGKQPFFNFNRIPPFTRLAVASFVVIHIALSLLLEPAQRYALFSTLGFTPGVFTGTLPWTPFALLSPFTSLFLHGSWMHLAFNLVMMLAMGVFFERQFGFKRTALFFFACGLAGDAFYFLFSPFTSEPVIGASGAISGLFAATFMIMHQQGYMSGMAMGAGRRGPLPFILLWLVLIILTGMISYSTAWQAHLGGFLGGLGLYHLWRTGKIRF